MPRARAAERSIRPERGRRDRRGSLLRRGRSLLLTVLLAATLGAAMLVSPAQRYFEARERVQVLELKDEVLQAEVARLERRIEQLEDPRHIELLAREHHGMIRPGEVPYTIVAPEPHRPMITAAAEVEPPAPGLVERWWQWAWQILESR